MKNITFIAFLFLILTSACGETPVEKVADKQKFQNGDIIFQTSKSEQSKAIQKATNSKYSHIGIIYKDSNSYFVLEAVQPVKMTPLNKWIEKGEKGHFVVKRLNANIEIISKKQLKRMKTIGEAMLGRDYDEFFEWNDKSMYCSELVWKIYKRGSGIQLCATKKLGDFELSNPEVQKKLKERYRKEIPLQQKVVSPADIFNSELLVTVYSN